MVNGDNLHKLHITAFCLFIKRILLENRRGSVSAQAITNSKIQKLNRRKNKGCVIYLLVSKQYFRSGTQGGFFLKTHQVFFVDTAPKELKTQ